MSSPPVRDAKHADARRVGVSPDVRRDDARPSRAGDSNSAEREQAFDRLFREHHPGLVQFASRLVGSRALAEEVVQDVFVELWESYDERTVSWPTRSYLYRAVRFLSLMRLRRRRLEARWVEEADARARPSRERPADVAAHARAPDADAETAELEEAVAAAVAELPERCRLVFALSRQQGLTYPEIASVMGISVKTVEAQMSRAFRQLRVHLTRFLGITVLIASTVGVLPR